MNFRKTVMVFGTFDLLHSGHRNFFKQARRYGDKLIVVAARDLNVWKAKKRKPVFNEKTRLKNIRNIRIVNQALLGGKSDSLEIILREKPQIILLGYDQKIGVLELKRKLLKRGLKVIVRRAKSYKPRIYKSSKLAKLHQIVK